MNFKTGEIIIDREIGPIPKYRELFIYIADSGFAGQSSWPVVIRIGTYVPPGGAQKIWWPTIRGQFEKTDRIHISSQRGVVRPTTEELKKIMNEINKKKKFKYNIIKAVLGHR